MLEEGTEIVSKEQILKIMEKELDELSERLLENLHKHVGPY